VDNVLTAILVCGLLGFIGQGTRAIIGLNNNAALGQNANQQSVFNLAYLGITLFVGFIAGDLAGYFLGFLNGSDTAPSAQNLLALIAAGYAGTDFIENTFTKLLPLIGSPAPVAPTQSPANIAQNANAATVQSLTDTVQKLSTNVASLASQTTSNAQTAKPAAIVGFDLAVAIKKILPSLNSTIWLPLLTEAFSKYSINTPLRAAAAMGQFVAEAGENFHDLQENMSYTTAQLLEYFPDEVKDQATADRLVNDGPQAIGNFVYANRNGNRDVASGDGFKFRGGGLCQLTGRTEYTEFATAMKMDVDHAAAYVATPEGAAISGCWYLSAKGCLPFADQWNLTKVTEIVNGGALLALNTRIDYANQFRNEFGAPMP
jgi:predicted chitinase